MDIESRKQICHASNGVNAETKEFAHNLKKKEGICSFRKVLTPFRRFGSIQEITKVIPLFSHDGKIEVYSFTLTLLHSKRPKLYTILVFLYAIGLIMRPTWTSLQVFGRPGLCSTIVRPVNSDGQ